MPTQTPTLRPEAAPSASALAKWGSAMSEGFVFTPRALLRHQSELGLSALDVVVLLNLAGSWWTEGGDPYVRVSTLAKRVGLTPRSVQRCIGNLEQRGFIAKHRAPGNGRTSTVIVTRYDLSGLVAKLQAVAAPTGAQVQMNLPAAA